MKNEDVNFHNYMTATTALFKGCRVPKRKPDFISESGSKYWQQENKKGKYVIRLSNHWVYLKEIGNNEVWKDCDRIASCIWHLKTNRTQWGCMLAGKCYLNNFKKLN